MHQGPQSPQPASPAPRLHPQPRGPGAAFKPRLSPQLFLEPTTGSCKSQAAPWECQEGRCRHPAAPEGRHRHRQSRYPGRADGCSRSCRQHLSLNAELSGFLSVSVRSLDGRTLICRCCPGVFAYVDAAGLVRARSPRWCRLGLPCQCLKGSSLSSIPSAGHCSLIEPCSVLLGLSQ